MPDLDRDPTGAGDDEGAHSSTGARRRGGNQTRLISGIERDYSNGIRAGQARSVRSQSPGSKGVDPEAAYTVPADLEDLFRRERGCEVARTLPAESRLETE